MNEFQPCMNSKISLESLQTLIEGNFNHAQQAAIKRLLSQACSHEQAYLSLLASWNQPALCKQPG